LYDLKNNPATGADGQDVMATVNTGGGTLKGTTTVSADAAGKFEFTDLKLSDAGTITVKVDCACGGANLTVDAAAITVTGGSAVDIAFD
jgi:hypothetical protein